MIEFTNPNPVDALHTVLLVTQYLCIPIVSIFVFLRLGIRLYYKQNIGIEDYSCYIAWFLFMAYCAVSIVVAQKGGGYHIWDLADSQTVEFLKFGYVATVVYCPMALIVKVALLSILIRIFSPYKTKVVLIYVFLGALCVYYIIAEVIKIRMCDPIPAYWLGNTAKCFDQQAALIADSVISVVSDFIILVTPLPLTWSLQMSRNKKLRIVGILSAGGLATAFSLYRLVLVVKEGQSQDQTIVFTCVILSGNAEAGVGIICCCLPTVNLVLSKLRQYGSSANRSHGYGYNNDSSVPLSKVRGFGSKGATSKGNSRRDPDGTIDYGTDQSHLISYAGAVEREPDSRTPGIHKTVDVSQTVEMVDEHQQSGARKSPSL